VNDVALLHTYCRSESDALYTWTHEVCASKELQKHPSKVLKDARKLAK
jgi:hypothetical protein